MPAKKDVVKKTDSSSGIDPANPNLNSPSVHDLAVQQVEEAYGPDAHNNPTFDARVKDVEAQMLNSIEVTKGM